MKSFKQYFLILLLTSSLGCAMFKHEAERSIRKDVKEYMDDNFDSYATAWYKGKWDSHKTQFITNVGIISGTMGVVATTLGILAICRKLKKKKDEDI